MNSLAYSSALTVTPSSFTVDATNTYTFSLTFYSTPSVNDYLLLTFPTGMTTAATPTCSAISGIAAVSCSTSNSSHLVVNLVAVPSSSISFSATNIKNYQLSGTALNLQLITYSSNTYGSEQTPSVSVTFTPSSLTTTTNNDDQIALS